MPEDDVYFCGSGCVLEYNAKQKEKEKPVLMPIRRRPSEPEEHDVVPKPGVKEVALSVSSSSTGRAGGSGDGLGELLLPNCPRIVPPDAWIGSEHALRFPFPRPSRLTAGVNRTSSS